MERRYDIDWLRVIAIGLLLIYHVAIGFQSWGVMIGFIASEKTWESLWIPMTMLNVWRIPLLFFVSGMGVYFAMQRRTWKALMLERTSRILLPYVFGTFCIFPVSDYIWRHYYHWGYNYTPNPGHLWFLGNIFSYVLILSPLFFYLKKNEEGKIATWIKKIISNPMGMLVVVGLFLAEVWIIDPHPFELYAMTPHGYFLGLIAFFFGFCFVFAGQPFLKMILSGRWLFFCLAAGLFAFRLKQFPINAPGYLLVIESQCWILAALTFGNRYLNHSGKALQYLSPAAYPVYILHMIFLFLGSMFIFKLDVPGPVQFVLVLLFTITGCFAGYEVIRRIRFLRALFGVKAS